MKDRKKDRGRSANGEIVGNGRQDDRDTCGKEEKGTNRRERERKKERERQNEREREKESRVSRNI